jgi:archaellum component FlaC
MNNEQMEEIKRHFGVIAEGLRNEIRQVAEGHEVIRSEIRTLREENEQAHREILSAIKFSYAELDQRIRTLEESVSSLQSRMERLEARQ